MNKITVFSSCYGKHAFKQGISSLFTPLSLAHPGSLASSLPSPLTHNQKPPFVLTVTLFLLSSSLIPLALFSPAPVFLEPLSPSRLSCPSPPGLPWFVVPLSLCPPPVFHPHIFLSAGCSFCHPHLCDLPSASGGSCPVDFVFPFVCFSEYSG